MFVHSDIYDKIRNVDRTYSLLPIPYSLFPITYSLFPISKAGAKIVFFHKKSSRKNRDYYVFLRLFLKN